MPLFANVKKVTVPLPGAGHDGLEAGVIAQRIEFVVVLHP